MSQEKVELVRRFYEAFNRGDHAWANLMAPDVELIAHEVGSGQTVGSKGVIRGMEEFTSVFASYEVSPEEFHDAGDQVVVGLRRRVKSARSPTSIEDSFAQVISVRGGRIVRFESFPRVSEALEAAGISR
jgi:ketosteroid isomerase-like protein